MFEFEVTRELAAGLIFFVLCGCVYVPLTVKFVNHRKAKKSRVSLPSNWNFKKLRAE